MKFQKLTLHNLASIEDAVVDFEAAPLAHSEVFLITGKTGSGKSTLLDAICLALYADTPRLKNTQMQGKNLEGKQAIQCSDPRQLLRQGAGEGFVSLTFTGSDGVTYEATWEVFRAHNKPTGNLQPKRWKLHNLHTDQVLTKEDDIREAIAQAVGLDFAQFCRTTLLAQGDFTRFLNSKDEEKAAILEKITGTDAYSKIGAKVYERTLERRQAWEAVRKQVSDLQTFSDEELTERMERLKALEAQMAERQGRWDRGNRVRSWRQAAEEAEGDIRAALRALQTAQAQVDTPEFRARQQQVAQWKDTLQVRADRRAMQAEEAERNRLHGVLQEELAAEFGRLTGAWRTAEAQVAERQRTVDRGRVALEGEAAFRPFYAEARTLAGQLREWKETSGRREAAAQQAAAGRRTVEDVCNPAVKQAEERRKEAETVLEQERKACAQAEAALEALQLEPLKRLRERWQQVQMPLHSLRVALAHGQETERQFREAQEQLEERERTLADRRQALADLLPLVQQAQATYDRCRRQLDVQRDTVDKFAQTLRARLQVGMECPVCRQVLTQALPTEDELKALVDQVQAETDRAQQALQEQQKEQFRLQAFVQNETEALAKERAHWATGSARSKAREEMLKAGQELEAQLKNGRELEAQLKAGQELEAQLKNGRELEAQLKAGRELEAQLKDGQELKAGRELESQLKALCETTKETDITVLCTRMAANTTPEPTFFSEAQQCLNLLKQEIEEKEAEIGRRLKEGEAVEKQVQEGHRRREQQQQQVDKARVAVFEAQQKRQEVEGQVRTAEALQQAQQNQETTLFQALQTSLADFPEPTAFGPAAGGPSALLPNEGTEGTSNNEAEGTSNNEGTEGGVGTGASLTFPDWQTEPLAFAEALLQAEARDREAQQRQQQEENLLQQETRLCQEGAEAVGRILDTLPAWQTLEALPCPTAPADWTGDLHRLHARVTSTVEQGKAARQRARQFREAVDAFLAAHPELPLETLEALQAVPANQIEAAERELLALQQAVAGQQTLLQAARNKAARVNDERPPYLDEVLQKLTNSTSLSETNETEETEETEGTTGTEEAEGTTGTEEAVATNETDEAGKPEVDETTLDQLLTQALDHLQQELLAQSEQKGAWQQELQADAENRKKLGDLHEKAAQAEKQYLQWARLNELVGDATGKKFRQIAQSYVLDNLIHSANHYLAKLTDRYTLKVKPGSFLILLEDAYQGYASRVASTLSGGESFLVSLALALALSDIGHEFSVDTLFIDEGFGTLSGEPLQQAINTLRSLHSQSGRHVGIISHVEELRERIPVQIQVEQEVRDSSSRVRVVPEQE